MYVICITFIEYHNLIFVQKLLYNALYFHSKLLNMLCISNIITFTIGKINSINEYKIKLNHDKVTKKKIKLIK